MEHLLSDFEVLPQSREESPSVGIMCVHTHIRVLLFISAGQFVTTVRCLLLQHVPAWCRNIIITYKLPYIICGILRCLTKKNTNQKTNNKLLDYKVIKVEIKGFVFIYLNVSNVLCFLTLTGRLFHRVAAGFPKHLLIYVTPRFCDAISSILESELRDLIVIGGSSMQDFINTNQNLVLPFVYMTSSQCREFRTGVI